METTEAVKVLFYELSLDPHHAPGRQVQGPRGWPCGLQGGWCSLPLSPDSAVFSLVWHVTQISLHLDRNGQMSASAPPAHNVYNGRQSIVLCTNITFVRIDEQGEPIPISDRVKEKHGF